MKTPKGKAQPKGDPAEIELHEDAMPRFERFIKQIAKAGPQHREAKLKKERAASGGRVRKAKARS